MALHCGAFFRATNSTEAPPKHVKGNHFGLRHYPPPQVEYGHQAYAYGHTHAATYGDGHPHGQVHYRQHYSGYPSNTDDGRETSSFDKLSMKVMSQAGPRDKRPFTEEGRDEASTGGGGRFDNYMSGEDEGSSDPGTTRDRANSSASHGDDEGDDRVNSAVGSLLTLLASADESTKSDECKSRRRKRSRTEGHHDVSSYSTTSLPHRFEDVHSGVGQETGMASVSGWLAKLPMD